MGIAGYNGLSALRFHPTVLTEKSMGSFLIAITIYVSLIAYLLAVVCWVAGRRDEVYRVLWTVGCTFLWAHALCAFHFYHGWSHADAVRLTAEQTKAVIGYEYGNGIWYSYLLLLIWMIDVVRLWRIGIPKPSAAASETETNESVCRSSWFWPVFSYCVHAYAFFILFNGTVVFEEGAVRWGGIIGTLWIIQMAWRFRAPRSLLGFVNANLKAKS